MKIGELAKEAGTTVQTVRYYEREGLLPAAERGMNNYRHYGETHLERLRLIRNCRALDMTQEEIREVLALSDHGQSRDGGCSAINAVFDAHIEHVDARIDELKRLKRQLQALRSQCAEARPHAQDCGILHELAHMDPIERPERHTHLG